MLPSIILVSSLFLVSFKSQFVSFELSVFSLAFQFEFFDHIGPMEEALICKTQRYVVLDTSFTASIPNKANVSVRICILPSVIKITYFIIILGVSLWNFYIIPLGHAKNCFTDGSPSHKNITLPQIWLLAGIVSYLAKCTSFAKLMSSCHNVSHVILKFSPSRSH